MNRVLFASSVLVLAAGCYSPGSEGAAKQSPKKEVALADVMISNEQDKEIRSLVEQLVMAEGAATNRPAPNPNMKIHDADGKDVTPTQDKQAEEYRKKFNACQAAFVKLLEFGITAFPILIEHLDDKRQSTNFRNHYLGNSVGDACQWNIYYQLMDMPKGYSSYGHSRPGRDGRNHPKPYWEGTPFDEAGGLREWLKENKDLTYTQMRIKCLQWLLEKEKAIGASDAASYFENILPLEVRVLERRRQLGEDVAEELAKKRRTLVIKDAAGVPPEALPERAGAR